MGGKAYMHCLVTGGNGFLGKYIVEHLLKRGYKVRVLGRHRYPDLEKSGVETVQADLADSESIIKACKGIDQVFHVAALTGIWGSYQNFYNTNVIGTKNIITACKKSGIQKLIYTSSPSVVFDNQDQKGIDETYPCPKRYLCYYSQTKAMAEQMVIAANATDGLSTVALRPHLIWGPRDTNLIPRVIDRARRRRLIQVGSGQNLVDICYVENAAHAHLLAADHLKPDSLVAGSCYFITDGKPVNLWDWINGLLQQLDLPPIKKRISYKTAWRIGRMMEGVYKLFCIQREPLMTRFLASQLAKSHYFSIEQAKKELGYRPPVSPEEGIGRLVKYLKKT
ncbi:MAG: NAD-dependent epimerase/dehydratase family protein [bacterium]